MLNVTFYGIFRHCDQVEIINSSLGGYKCDGRWAFNVYLEIHKTSLNQRMETKKLSHFRLTARDVENVMISSSVFTTIPWPGIYIYNASKITIHRNIFQSVAPRSLVFKNGQALEVIQNGLDVTSALDVSQFASLSIYCNRPTSTKLPLNCDHNSEEEAEFSEVDHDQWRTLISFLTIGFGPFWLFMLIGAVASVSLLVNAEQ